MNKAKGMKITLFKIRFKSTQPLSQTSFAFTSVNSDRSVKRNDEDLCEVTQYITSVTSHWILPWKQCDWTDVFAADWMLQLSMRKYSWSYYIVSDTLTYPVLWLTELTDTSDIYEPHFTYDHNVNHMSKSLEYED